MDILSNLYKNLENFLDYLGRSMVAVDLPFSKFFFLVLLFFIYFIIKIFSRVINDLCSSSARAAGKGVGSMVQGLSESAKYLSDEAKRSRAWATKEQFEKMKNEMIKEQIKTSSKSYSLRYNFILFLKILGIIAFLFTFFVLPWTLGDILSANSKMAYSFLALFLGIIILWWGGDIGKY